MTLVGCVECVGNHRELVLVSERLLGRFRAKGGWAVGSTFRQASLW